MDSNPELNKYVVLPVEGMTCAACVSTVTSAVRSVAGILQVSVSLASETATINFESNKLPVNEVVHAITDFGYQVTTSESILASDALNDPQVAISLKEYLENIDGIVSVNVNRATSEITIRSVYGLFNTNEILNLTMKFGVNTQLVEGTDSLHSEIERLSRRSEINRVKGKMLFSGFVALLLWSLGIAFNPVTSGQIDWLGWISLLLAAPVQSWAASEFYKSAWGSLKHFKFNMNTLIALGTSVAYFYSAIVVISRPFIDQVLSIHFDTATIIISLVLFGRMLESQAKGKASDAIIGLMDLQAKYALVQRGTNTVEVPIDEVALGEFVLVKPGSKIPLDGEVFAGASTVDESMLTGESTPSDKIKGAVVYGGTVNLHGSFTFRVTRAGDRTTLAQIIHLVRLAQGSQASIQRLADAFASHFVPAVLLFAFFTYCYWAFFAQDVSQNEAMLTTIAVLIIACPCALGLATPAAIMIAITTGAKYGILIRSAEALEILGRVDTVFFDKTGTLTSGKLKVEKVYGFEFTESEVLGFACSVESHSEHLLAKAIIDCAQENEIETPASSNFQVAPGLGVRAVIQERSFTVGSLNLARQANIVISSEVEAKVNELLDAHCTPIAVLMEEKIIGLIGLTDEIRFESKQVVSRLRSMGLRVGILTGDHYAVTRSLASKLAVDSYVSEILPSEKHNQIKQRQALGHKVAMVGDGINDAPALAQADAGIAMSSASDISLNVADFVLMGANIQGVTTGIRLSRKTITIIKQNLFWAFGYNIILIPIAAGFFHLFVGEGSIPSYLHWILGENGFLNPNIAALAMATSSVSVMFNSLRLRTWDPYL